jgi:hypothetical protein
MIGMFTATRLCSQHHILIQNDTLTVAIPTLQMPDLQASKPLIPLSSRSENRKFPTVVFSVKEKKTGSKPSETPIHQLGSCSPVKQGYCDLAPIVLESKLSSL